MLVVKSLIWFNYIFLKEAIIRNYWNIREKSKIEFKKRIWNKNIKNRIEKIEKEK